VADRGGLGRRYHRLFGASVVSNLGDGLGAIAYPWLASAITRNPALIALVVVAQRLPWLVFTLPVGVITDRVDRRRAMIAMDWCRALLTGLVAMAVLGRQGTLPSADALDTVVGTDVTLYLVVVAATLLLGMAEVLRDNSAQTILPAIVPPDRLEKANGQMWSAESVTNTFVGPPLGSVLLAVAFALPFFLHAGMFALAAVLLTTIDGSYRADDDVAGQRRPWRRDLAEGVRWLWGHDLLRPMAIILGVLNGTAALTTATFVLFAQENLGVGPLLFTVIGFGGAIGAVSGGVVAPRLTARFGPGTCLSFTLAGSAVVPLLIGVSSHWTQVVALFSVTALLGIVWNVITVSLRQAIIPSRLLGRVNSVYRMFAWGMIPIGAALGGAIVMVAGQFLDRGAALRAVWFVAAVIHAVVFVASRGRLSTERIEAARASAGESDVSRSDASSR
jgi:MFS family permease